jgi:predicted enzyme related to lactoylglutathione lyase
MNFDPWPGLTYKGMKPEPTNPVVHLELHTGDLPGACTFYAGLFGWRQEEIDAGASSYLALEMGGEIGGGVVQCGTTRPLWLPYVEVADLSRVTERARELGAAVSLEPREGPAGWRSVVATPAGAEIALWQPKR